MGPHQGQRGLVPSAFSPHSGRSTLHRLAHSSRICIITSHTRFFFLSFFLSECDDGASKAVMNGLAPGSNGQDKGKALEEKPGFSTGKPFQKEQSRSDPVWLICLVRTIIALISLCKRELFPTLTF